MPSAFNPRNRIGQAADPTNDGERSEGARSGRRWTSFLTWAFVLTEMAGRDGFLPNGAAAAEDEAGHTLGSSESTTVSVNQLPNSRLTTDDVQPSAVADAKASIITQAEPSDLAGELARPASETGINADTTPAGGSAGTGAVTDSNSEESSTSESDTATQSDAVGSAATTLMAFNQAGEALDLGLNLGLQMAPTWGSLVNSTLATAEQPIASILGLDAGYQGFDLGLPGMLDFSAGSSGVGNTLAAPGGGYSNYGISLSLGLPEGGGGDPAGLPEADLTYALSDTLFGDDDNSFDTLQVDQAVLRAASDLLT
jgi:hypothetical protein